MTQASQRPPAPQHHYHAEMLSVEEARERILSHFSVLPAGDMPLGECLGMVLAEDLTAGFDVPPAANSAMDGYAVNAADFSGREAPLELPVSMLIPAGSVPDGPLRRGTAARIMTGAPLPEGADAVAPFEETDEVERRKRGGALDHVTINILPGPGASVRPAGEDIKAGALVLRKGAVMRPGEIGVAASLGRATVRVHRRPSVAIISTGDELIEPGTPGRPGKIYNSNAYSLSAAVRKYGGVPVQLGIAGDTVDSLQGALDRAASADMVITSGGVSKGDYDVVKDVLSKRGKIALWSVRMRPAKPLAFGVLEYGGEAGRPVPHLGLPGNPVSAMVAFEQFARPAIHLMMGRTPLPKPTVTALLDDPIVNSDGRRVYARVTVYRDPTGVYRAKSTGNQSSGALTSIALANGLAICPEDVSRLDSGENATVEMLDWPEQVF